MIDSAYSREIIVFFASFLPELLKNKQLFFQKNAKPNMHVMS